MFNNVGKQIKTLAEVICFLCICASILIGILFFERNFFVTIISIAIGGIVGFCCSIGLYGFGELISQTTATREMNEEILKSLEMNRETNERILAILEAQHDCEHVPDVAAYQPTSDPI